MNTSMDVSRVNSGRTATRREATLGKLKRGGLIAAGTSCVGLGLLGVFLPLLPTTPFLLLAAACYARSSDRFHRWLLTNRVFGRYLDNYIEKREVPLRLKLFTLLLLWATISYSALVVIDNVPVRAVLFLIAMSVSIHVLLLRTSR